MSEFHPARRAFPVPAALLFAALLALVPAASAGAQWTTPPSPSPLVQQHTFESAAAGATVSYHVLLPAGYAQAPDRHYPVLYWLHGAGSPLVGIAPLSQWFTGAMAQGNVPACIVVFPNGMPYGMWTDSKDGGVPMETVVFSELLPEIDARFRTIPNRLGRLLEGFSMGGYGAGRLGFEHHDLFGTVSMLGAGPLQLDFLNAPAGSTMPWELRLAIYEQVWGSDPEYFLAQSPWMRAQQNAAALLASGQRLRLAVGTLDFVAPDNATFQAHLTQLGLPHGYFLPAGIAHEALPLLAHLASADPDFYRDAFEHLGPGGGAITVVPGCQTSGATLLATGGEARIGTTLQLTIAAPSVPNGWSQLFLGLAAPSESGCGIALPGLSELLLAVSPQPLLLAQKPVVGGAAPFALPIPNEPAWIGLELALQAVVLAPIPLGVSVATTNGLALRLGQ